MCVLNLLSHNLNPLIIFAFIVFHLDLVAARPTSIWHVSIDNSPAPPPDKGPPLSASASRDKSLLPFQIAGILGAYVIWTVTGLTLLIFVGRRLRRGAQQVVITNMEMVKPNVNAIAMGLKDKDPSPVSPIKQWESPTDSDTTAIWPSPAGSTQGYKNRSWIKPSGGSQRNRSADGSVLTFDEDVIENDKQRAQSEMDRLYAAVAVHDAQQGARQAMQKSQASLRSPVTDSFPSIASPVQETFAPMRSPAQENFTPGLPSSPRQQQTHSTATSLASPRQQQFASPLASPQFAQYAHYQPPMSPGALSHPMAPTPLSPPLSPGQQSFLSQGSGRFTKPSPLSFFTGRSRNNNEDSPKKSSFRISIKGMPISSPITSPRAKNSVGFTGDNGPISPRVYTPGYPPPTPGNRASNVTALQTIPQSAEPSPQPMLHSNDIKPSRAAPPAPLSLRSPTFLPNDSSNPSKSIGALPLRSYPTPPQSAPYTKVQYADRRESKLYVGPKTGVPYPHSPYMPFSPVTPVSATIRTGKDLKIAKKMARLDETEMVKSEKEIW